MHSRLLVLGFFAIGCKPAPPAPRASGGSSSPEYFGVYQSTPDEDYFTPCGTNDVGDTWTLSFRDNEPLAPFLKKVTAVRGYGPLTHFIRFRGRLGAAGSYNAGFQTRQVEVDSILEVSESLKPCVGYGVPAAWAGVPQDISGLKGIALSPDRSLAALMDNDRQISIWSTASGKVLTRFPSFDKAGTRSPNGSPMTFSRDGQLLAVGMVDGLVRVWRTIDGKGLLTLRLKDSVDVVRELTANPPPPNVFISPPRDWGAAPKEIVFNKSGTMLATNNTFSTIIWSVETGKRLAEFNQRHDFLSHALFVGDSGLLMTADSGRMMFRSDLNAEPTIRPGTKSRTTEPVVMSPDERFLAAKGWIDSIFLWSVNGEIPEREINVPAFAMGALAFSPDGNAMAAAGGYNGLYVWDTRTGEPIKSFHNFPGVVSRAWFSADGKAIITYSAFDQRLRIVYVDSAARAAAAGNLLDSLTARQPLRRPMNSPATVGGTVMASQRAIPGAEVTISNGDTPASVVARATTSSGGYFSFPGIRFPHVDIRVRKSGFAPGVKYVHLNIAEDGGTTIIELKPAVGGDGAPGSL